MEARDIDRSSRRSCIFVSQLVLRYGIFFRASDAKEIIKFVAKDHPAITAADSIEVEDASIIFSYDSDRAPTYAMLFIDKLTIGTTPAPVADCLSVDFDENDLAAWRSRYTPACIALEKIHSAIVGEFPQKKVVFGWRSHVCVWKTDELSRVDTRSKALNCNVTAPRPQRTSHSRNYSLAEGAKTVNIVKK